MLLQVYQIKALSDWRFDDVGGNEERARMELSNFYKSLGQKKYQFDRLDASGLPGFNKRPFDRLDAAQLSGMNKKAFDMLENSKLGGFQKRPFDSLEGALPGSWKRYIHRPHIPY
ncbi:hypothetical protein D918_05386 [Trichuris suis]|nr:hypothetical protein D918_05386 [Trichuris suis]